MKLIELTKPAGGKIYVNPSDISWVTEGEGVNLVGMSSGEDNYVWVTETPEEIVKLLEECE